jgi:hypothetical protein
VRVLKGRQDAHPQLLHILVGHVRLRVIPVHALRCVVPVALYNGHDQALLDGAHGAPQQRRDRVDVGRLVFQLEAVVALEKAALFAEPIRKRPTEAGATVLAP